MRTMPMIWSAPKNRTRRPCSACGRELQGEAWEVHVINGGSDILHPDDEDQYRPDGGDMGLHPVGPECRKKFGEFATRADSLSLED